MRRINPRGIMRRRSAWAAVLFTVLAVLLSVRLFHIQIIDSDKYKKMALNQTEGVQVLYSPRGTIFDRNGKRLAFSVMVKSLYCDPGMIHGDPKEIAGELSPLLHQSEEELIEKLTRDTRFVWIQRLMDPEDSDSVISLLKERKWEGLRFVDESRRYYPNGPLLANVLGFVGIDDMGLDGLEMSMDDLIGGTENKQRLLMDARGNPILQSALAPYKAEGERSVHLTIDQNIQFYAERALDRAMENTRAQGGLIIVMDPQTGGILALGSRPTYDPNHFDKAKEEDFKNKAVVDIYEPGSTFKPIIAAAALEAGTYSAETVWSDPGEIRASGHVIKNWNDGSYGDVKLVDIIKYSINTGFAHIGLLTGGKTLTEYAKKFGFGKVTGIELPGEEPGLLFDPEHMKDIDVATMSIGQGIAVTPLQMLQAYSALANGGKMVKPHVLESVRNPDGTVYKSYETEYAGEPVSKEVADQVKDMMEKEVSEGGGMNARVPGYRMGGKTGTAQKLDALRGGYLENEYIASFCGFGPIENPRAICLVVLDNPRGVYYGGLVAAPVFKEAMGQIMRYLEIPSNETREQSEENESGYGNKNFPEIPDENTKEFHLPNFYGWSIRDAGSWLGRAGLGFKPEGTGYADAQSPGPGVTVKRGEDITVHFSK